MSNRLDRDKVFYIIRNVFDDERMSDEKFKKVLEAVGLYNPKYYQLLKEYRIVNKTGFLKSNYAPFAHRNAGDRKANMKGEKAYYRAKKNGEKQKAAKQIQEDIELYYQSKGTI
jgi:sRNA-binding protein